MSEELDAESRRALDELIGWALEQRAKSRVQPEWWTGVAVGLRIARDRLSPPELSSSAAAEHTS